LKRWKKRFNKEEKWKQQGGKFTREEDEQ
jgi:hypothetical protein